MAYKRNETCNLAYKVLAVLGIFIEDFHTVVITVLRSNIIEVVLRETAPADCNFRNLDVIVTYWQADVIKTEVRRYFRMDFQIVDVDFVITLVVNTGIVVDVFIKKNYTNIGIFTNNVDDNYVNG